MPPPPNASMAPGRRRRATPHPFPSRAFGKLDLPLVERQGPWVRLFRPRHAPLHFGQDGAGRFDAPNGEYGVLYVADELAGAFIEVFGRDPAYRIISAPTLESRNVALTAGRPLRLVDLRDGPGLAAIAATGELTMGGNYRLSHAFSRAINRHPAAPDGIWYRCRHDPSQGSVAVFDRAQSVLEANDLGSLPGTRFLVDVAQLLDRYHFGLDSSSPHPSDTR
jgi:RES domain